MRSRPRPPTNVITQLLNLGQDYPGFSRRLVKSELGTSLMLAEDLSLSFYIPRETNRERFADPDDFELEVAIDTPKIQRRLLLHANEKILMSEAPLVIWPVAVDIQLPMRYVRSITLKVMATDPRVQWAI